LGNTPLKGLIALYGGNLLKKKGPLFLRGKPSRGRNFPNPPREICKKEPDLYEKERGL